MNISISMDASRVCMYPLNIHNAQLVSINLSKGYKKLIRRWDSERELSLRQHSTRTTKYINWCIN